MVETQEAFLEPHPDASLIEVIDAAGFSSRSSFYAVKAKLRPEK